MSYIVADKLSKKFGKGDAAVAAVADISFQIGEGDFVAVMGESGAGKSTLLGIMGAMNAPTSGKLVVDDIDIYSLGQEHRTDFRREFLGFIFQSFHLVPYLTVIENVMLPLELAGHDNPDEAAKTALQNVGLAKRSGHYPRQLSGGEKQRVAIARAYVVQPTVLFADEPTGNLDSENSEKIFEILRSLSHNGLAIVMITHNPDLAARANQIIHIRDGLVHTKS